ETPLTMAETASIFSEMLMTDHLLNTTSGREEKISFITGRIEEIFATTARQNMFTRFEIEAHKRISSEYLSFEELGELYFDELKHMFGETIDFLPESKYEWARIPHFFHTPFYCYAYNFAQLLVISLYRKYLEDGDVFKRKYVALLESGGSDSPEILLGKAGIDISSPRFWENGIDFIQENFLDRLRAMI
ncbi:M3 family metallopeptidase, partial [Mesotoga sp.]